MNLNDLNTIEQLEPFLTGSQSVAFLMASSKEACYRGVQRILVKFRYASLNKRSKGVVVRFLIKITGYSRQQVTRLVKQYRDSGKIERHNTLSGPATKKLWNVPISFLNKHNTNVWRLSRWRICVQPHKITAVSQATLQR